ncbi:MAG: hypothetical protein AAGA87_12140 [Pseudomonadota bacterium]
MGFRLVLVIAFVVYSGATSASTFIFPSAAEVLHFSPTFYNPQVEVTGNSKEEQRVSFEAEIEELEAECTFIPEVCTTAAGTITTHQEAENIGDFETEYQLALDRAQDAGALTFWSNDQFSVFPSVSNLRLSLLGGAATLAAHSDFQHDTEEGFSIEFKDGVKLQSFVFEVSALRSVGGDPALLDGSFDAIRLAFPGLNGVFRHNEVVGTHRFYFGEEGLEVGSIGFSLAEFEQRDIYFTAEITELVTIDQIVSTVPLPASFGMLMLGGLMLASLHRRHV